METIFMNTGNSKTNGSNKYIYQFTKKLNLKTSNNKNIGWINLSLSNQNTTTINLKYLLQLGMMNLICMIVLIQFLTIKITLNLSSKNTKR